MADRIQIESGGFFDRVPSGADAYIMRRALNAWPHEDAVRILRCLRAAMGPDARLLALEAGVGPPNTRPLAKFVELLLLVSAGGRARTESEWRDLFADGGFRLVRVHPVGPMSPVIEGSPV